MKSIVLVVIIGSVLLLSGCCAQTGKVQATGKNTFQQGTSAYATTQTEKISAKIEDGEIGLPYTIEYLGSRYEVRLNKVETAYAYYWNKEYLMAYFEIKNTGDSSDYFSPDIYFVGQDGEKYDKTIAIGIDDNTYDKTLDFFKKLTPGTKMSGWVAIEVPKSEQRGDLYFEYTNVWLSNTPKYIKYKINS
ncbi:hypothetical protein COU37_00645 [Candidatus Micrarchaeota archaeon CG10_big_fil_rev_8_21_14_0_10_45_29]|nr:MAG: hypothetical protein COU37_00645 [Candidatus Micrarchaeota archaeon CG10_big_fil_rev_8_21_14_0_10_45_29]